MKTASPLISYDAFTSAWTSARLMAGTATLRLRLMAGTATLRWWLMAGTATVRIVPFILALAAAAPAAESADGFQKLFDGTSLAGWKAADMSFWTVEDGAITARITPERPLKENLYLIWQGGELADFELKLKHRVFGSPGINCGFQFRSRELPNHDVAGYQVDNNLDTEWLVRLYDEHGRHTLAWRGQRTVFDSDGGATSTDIPEAKVAPWFRLDDWHEYHLMCVGPRLTLKVDGRLVAEVEDNDPRQRDAAGILALQLHTGPPTTAQFKDIELKVLKPAPVEKSASTPAPAWPLKDKTLVAWVSPANLDQRGGSALTIEKPGAVFDAIVLGELTPGKWMAGSDMFHRTQQDQAGYPAESATGPPPMQIAVTYRDREVSIFRNGVPLTRYSVSTAESFGTDSLVLIGLRHRDAAADNRFFFGSIDDARIYNVALDAAQLAALAPNQPSDPPPLAWWDFENGRVTDRMKNFSSSTLVGEARVAGGRLHLGSGGAYLLASRDDGTGGTTPGGRDANNSARALRERLLADPHRPGYHFVIPEGTAMPFDPNGAIFWKGRYHLFYIFQDARGHNWGHVSSTDLFHWRNHPTGLVSGMFSGNCFINKDGRPTMCYHQVGQGNAMAVALDDELNAWKKLESNPITPKTKPGDPLHDKYRSWDPFGWLEGDTYYAIFGGELPGVAKAPALDGEWTYVGDLMANAVPGVSINEDVSCADFFKLGNRHMLLCISHRLGARYYLGDWKSGQFHPTFHERMSWVDNSFFAPESLLDDRGRRIMWAWIFDRPEFKMRTDFGWSGTMSLPRVLSLDADGTLRIDVPEEIERLRYNGKRMTDLRINADSELALDGVRGNSLELAVEMTAPEAKRFGLKVCCSSGNEEETPVFYDAVEKRLKVDTNRSSATEGPKSVEAGPLELRADEPLRLRVFVDRSVVEVFANGRQAVMRRIYPSRGDSVGVKLFSTGGPARVTALEGWQMTPANPF